jgi:hypothetical protein
MPWKQCAISIHEDYECIEDGVALLALSAGDPPEVALFTRTTADRRQRVLLLSPLAVELIGDALASRWSDCDAPEIFEWDLALGPIEAYARLGLSRPHFGKPGAPCPVTIIGRDPRTPDPAPTATP